VQVVVFYRLFHTLSIAVGKFESLAQTGDGAGRRVSWERAPPRQTAPAINSPAAKNRYFN
jgi:hypothetical protein